MDTYASSAGDASGFYNIPALAPAVDGFFVMEYQLNLQSNGSAVSPLTSTMFSDRLAVDQYLAAVPASKILQGCLTSASTGPPRTARSRRRRQDRQRSSRTARSCRAVIPLLGPDNGYSLDVIRSWNAVVRGVLRGPDVLVRRGSAGSGEQLGWSGHLGARHGRKRPEHVVCAAWILAGRQGRRRRSSEVTSQSDPALSHHQLVYHCHPRYAGDRYLRPTTTGVPPSTTSAVPGHDRTPEHCSGHHDHHINHHLDVATDRRRLYSGDWNGRMVRPRIVVARNFPRSRNARRPTHRNIHKRPDHVMPHDRPQPECRTSRRTIPTSTSSLPRQPE